MSVSASLSMCKEAFSMTGNKSRIPRRCKETMAKVEQKQVVVNEIKEKLEKAASVVMVDARGLTVEQDTALRNLKAWMNIWQVPAHSHSLMKMQQQAQAS